MKFYRLLYFMAHESAQLAQVYDGRRWRYVVGSADGDVLAFVDDKVMGRALALRYVRNLPFTLNDKRIVYQLTVRGYNAAPTIRPPAFPALARGEQRGLLP